jgi:hypothetical protein
MKSKVVGALLLALSPLVNAKEFVVSYDGFYDRLKVVDKGQYQYARVNFYLVDIATLKPCEIKTGKLITENNQLPLSYTDKAQLLLPLDKQLDTDKAVIVVEPKNPAHDCQLKMQIEAPEFKLTDFNGEKLLQLNNEFDDLLTNLSGFFIGKLMAFLLPSQKGIQIEFEQPTQLANANCDGKVCRLEVDDGITQQSFALPLHEIKNVVPWISK